MKRSTKIILRTVFALLSVSCIVFAFHFWQQIKVLQKEQKIYDTSSVCTTTLITRCRLELPATIYDIASAKRNGIFSGLKMRHFDLR